MTGNKPANRQGSAKKQKLKEADTHWSHSKLLLKNYTNYLVGQQVIHIYSHSIQ